MGDLLVSVVIAVHNAGIYLRDALKSILQQTCGNIEIIIIDDGSTYHRIELVDDLGNNRIRLLRYERGGKAKALNLALANI
jgi:glycosyltransferase involved in cell wall biosynthesis